MSQAVRDLYEKASRLPPNDRAELASLLLESLHSQRSAANAEAWASEIARRMEDYRSGRVETLSWQEVRAHLHRAER